MGCGASTARAYSNYDEENGEFVHLKNLDQGMALPGAKTTRGTPEKRPSPNAAVKSKREGEDATEIADSRSIGASHLSAEQAHLVGATQQLLRCITTAGQAAEEDDRPLCSIGDHEALSRSGLSINAGINQVGALRVLLRTSDPNVRDPDGERVPLHWAAARGHSRCAMALLKAGAGEGRSVPAPRASYDSDRLAPLPARRPAADRALLGAHMHRAGQYPRPLRACRAAHEFCQPLLCPADRRRLAYGDAAAAGYQRRQPRSRDVASGGGGGTAGAAGQGPGGGERPCSR